MIKSFNELEIKVQCINFLYEENIMTAFGFLFPDIISTRAFHPVNFLPSIFYFYQFLNKNYCIDVYSITIFSIMMIKNYFTFFIEPHSTLSILFIYEYEYLV